MAKKNTIRCPHCGCEYLPGEIFYPDQFLGQPKKIFKDEEGTILGFDEDMDTNETFECYKCGKKFSVEAIVTFKTAPYDDLFDEDDEFLSEVKKEK